MVCGPDDMLYVTNNSFGAGLLDGQLLQINLYPDQNLQAAASTPRAGRGSASPR